MLLKIEARFLPGSGNTFFLKCVLTVALTCTDQAGYSCIDSETNYSCFLFTPCLLVALKESKEEVIGLAHLVSRACRVL